MNYNYPYYRMMHMTPTASLPIRGTSSGTFSKLLKGFNWSSLLNNTQKTLNLVNQAIPLVKQASPILKNAKTMFRVMNEFKKTDFSSIKSETNHNQKNNHKKDNIIPTQKETNNNPINDGGPVFFA